MAGVGDRGWQDTIGRCFEGHRDRCHNPRSGQDILEFWKVDRLLQMVVQMVVMVMVMDGKVKDEEHQDTIGKK